MNHPYYCSSLLLLLLLLLLMLLQLPQSTMAFVVQHPSAQRLSFFKPTLSLSSDNEETSSSSSSSSYFASSSSPEPSTLNSWTTSLSQDLDSTKAVTEVLQHVLHCDNDNNNNKSSPSPDLAFLFVSAYHARSFSDICKSISKQLSTTTRVVAVLGAGVVGGNKEVDSPSQPAISLLSGKLPKGTNIDIFDFNEIKKPPPLPSSNFWTKITSKKDNDNQDSAATTTTTALPSFILFCDPWSPIDAVLAGLKDTPVVAGGITVPVSADSTIALDGVALPQGSLVGVGLSGTTQVQAIVAQGCRPIGPEFTITAAQGNALLELNGKPAVHVLKEVTDQASVQDQRRMGTRNPADFGILVGISPNTKQQKQKQQQQQQHSDYLVRQVIGIQPKVNALIVGTELQVGGSFRFHVRDGDAAREDMKLMIQRAKTEQLFSSSSLSSNLFAALQVSCVARGRSLFNQDNVDLNEIVSLFNHKQQQQQGETINNKQPAAIAGFFANGEFGPVGLSGFTNPTMLDDSGSSNTYLHGFTTVAILLRETIATETNNNYDNDLAASNFNNDESSMDAWG